jgi:hypothetical protein
LNNKRKALFLLSVTVIATVLGSIILMSNANADTNTTNATAPSDATNLTQYQTTLPPHNNASFMTGDQNGMFGHRGMMQPGSRHGGPDCFGGATIQVSDEFKTNVTSIAENDSDVQNLISQGYNITAIKPIITTTIDGNGNVVAKATSAQLILTKDNTGISFVQVDLSQSKVTRIVTETRTVIEK